MGDYRVEIVKADESHVTVIAEAVRDADRVEFAAHMQTAEHVLRVGLRASRVAWTGTLDGVPICMFGVVPMGMMLADHGRPWMVGTGFLDRHAPLFLRRCRAQVACMLSMYPVLSNYVAASNVRAIQWLRWLGFRLAETPVSCGVHGVPFYYFELRRGE